MENFKCVTCELGCKIRISSTFIVPPKECLFDSDKVEFIKESLNTQLHVGTKPCNKHGYYKTFTTYKFCPCCGRALAGDPGIRRIKT